MKQLLRKSIYCSAFAVSMLCVSQAWADDRPPADAKPLSEIVKQVENQGYSPVTEVDMDDGVWQIDAYKNGHERELRVDPTSGRIISDRSEDDDD